MTSLKKKVRQAIVARNALKKMGENMSGKNPYAMKYLNEMGKDVLNLAAKTHRLLPYYIMTNKI